MSGCFRHGNELLFFVKSGEYKWFLKIEDGRLWVG